MPALPLENVGCQMNMIYTLRYTDETDRLIRTATIPCNDAQEAVRASALTMQNPYAALEVSLGDKVVWSGSKDRVNVWASNPQPKRLKSEQNAARGNAASFQSRSFSSRLVRTKSACPK